VMMWWAWWYASISMIWTHHEIVRILSACCTCCCVCLCVVAYRVTAWYTAQQRCLCVGWDATACCEVRGLTTTVEQPTLHMC
jgi:hypothetical protein